MTGFKATKNKKTKSHFRFLRNDEIEEDFN